ncbi:MAG: VCBS repeat-containing protein, partial [Planctomycetes bacterium]|nr:VCBS repeat-containing protein [Planctomycetota bacterium]
MKKAKALAVFCGLLALAGTALLAGCGGMNTPPAAGAVGPETVFAGYVAEFDGTTSSDLDEDELTYAWGLEARPADSAATMSTTDVPLSSLVPDVVGHYVISLVVKDEESHSPASYRSFEAKPWFRDATKEAGVGGLGISGQYFRLKSDPLAGAAWGDYDGDGDQDLWVAIALYGSTADQLYRNNGDGTFTDVAEEAGVAFAGEQYDPAYLDAIGGADQRDAARGVLWGDYDGDGDLDLYRVNSGSLSTDFAVPNNLYRNNGDGTFFDVAPDARVFDARFGMGGAWGDYDGDGDLDLAVANFARFNEDGTFSEADALYRNNGDGTFSDVAPPAGLGQPPPTPKDEWTTGMPRCAESWQPFWFDYDGDGALDYFVSCEVGSNLLYRNNGDGTFADVTEEAGLWGSTGHGIDAGDYDGDGDLDLFVTGTGTNRLWRNEGNGTFTDVTSAAGVGGPGGVG